MPPEPVVDGNAAPPPPAPPAPAAPSRCVLEDYTKCSESHLWKLMMSFYDRKGIESWSSGVVPHFITSNSFVSFYCAAYRCLEYDALCFVGP